MAESPPLGAELPQHFPGSGTPGFGHAVLCYTSDNEERGALGSGQCYRYLNNDPFRKKYLIKNVAKLVCDKQIPESVNRILFIYFKGAKRVRRNVQFCDKLLISYCCQYLTVER